MHRKPRREERAGETAVAVGPAHGAPAAPPGPEPWSRRKKTLVGTVAVLFVAIAVASRSLRLEDLILRDHRAVYWRQDTCNPYRDLSGCSAVILTNEVDFWYHLEKLGIGKNKEAWQVFDRWHRRFEEFKKTKKFVAHPYWYAIKNHIEPHIRCGPGELLCLAPNPFRNNQIARAVTFLEAVQANPAHDGFKVEKDKCLMTDWIALNNLPQPRRIGPWRELPASIVVLREIADGKMPEGTTVTDLQYPIFLKACHITQGAQHGTHMIKSAKDFKENFQKHMEWLRNIWTTISSDNERPWAAEALVLFPMVQPGVMIVEGWKWSNPEPAELKIEVFWGVGFMGFWLGSHPETGEKLGSNTDRDCRDIEPGTNFSWFCPVSQGAFDLAERAAATLGSDEVRIDLFIHPTDPNGHQINEISLFSGHPGARWFKTAMGAAWRFGYDRPDEIEVADDKGGTLPQPYAKWKA